MIADLHMFETQTIADDVSVSSMKTLVNVERTRLMEDIKQVESLNYDLCDYLCIGCYHILSSLKEDPQRNVGFVHSIATVAPKRV